MYLSEEIELLISESEKFDEEFKSKLFNIFDVTVRYDTEGINKVATKLKLVWDFICNKYSDLDPGLLDEYLYGLVDESAIEVKFKKLYEDSIIPTRSHEDDAGLDLYIHSIGIDSDRSIISCGLGVACEIPKGYVGLIFPRSSIYKTDLTLSNSVGVIDSGYRGELQAKFRVNGDIHYKLGDRCCQMIVMQYPKVIITEVEELSETERGTGGFGSTNK